MKKSTKLILKSLIFAGTLAFTTFVGAEGSEAANDKTKKEEKSTVEVQVKIDNEVKKGNSQAHLHASVEAKKNASPNSAVHRTVSTTAAEVTPVTEELENKKTDQTVTEEPVIEKEKSVKENPSVQNKAKAMASERASLRAKEKAAPNSAVHAVLPTPEEKPEKEEATEEVTDEKEKIEEDATEEKAEKEATNVEEKKNAQIEIVITASPSIIAKAKAMASQLASLIAKKQAALNLAVHADSSTSPLTNEIVVKVFVEEE